jgi:putative ABC transport system ATP-binding protein
MKSFSDTNLIESDIISAIDLKKYYQLGGSEVRAVDGIDLTVKKGEFISIVGASGSGKSTLLNLLAGLDTPTSGTITVPAGNLNRMNQHQLAHYRAHQVGMVFQSFNLVPHRTALANVELALLFLNIAKSERLRKARNVLEQLGLADRLHHRPADLSGGEQQRVAIARALVKNPQILLADEPTGNLDRDNSFAIIQLIWEWNRTSGTVILVTHNLELAEKYSAKILRMNYGKFVTEETASGNRIQL